MFEPAGTETQQRQSIVDELERLDERKREILAAVCTEIDEKHADLIRSCGLLSHVYGRSLADGRRVCVFCRAGVLVFPELDELPACESTASNAVSATTQVINRKWDKQSLAQLNEAFAEISERSSPMNEIGLIAAKEWALAHADVIRDPVDFGKSVALVASAANAVIEGAGNELDVTAALAAQSALFEMPQVPEQPPLHSLQSATAEAQVPTPGSQG